MTPGKETPRQPLYRDWRFWLAVLSFVFGVFTYFDARSERYRRVEVEAKLADTARRLEESKRCIVLEKSRQLDHLTGFTAQYVTHVNELAAAVSAYRESPNPETRRTVLDVARALVAMTGVWRRLLSRVEPLMDGTVSAADAAASTGDVTALEQLSSTLSRNAVGQIDALRAAIAALPPTDSSARAGCEAP